MAPKKPLVLVLLLMLGLILGIAAAFIRQALKCVVKNPKDIEARTSGKVQVLAHLDDQDMAEESLGSLSTSAWMLAITAFLLQVLHRLWVKVLLA